MATVHRKGKQINNVWSFDQVYAGVPAKQHCECGHTASVHLMTIQRTKKIAIKCDDCGCNTYNPVIELAELQSVKGEGE